MDNEKSYELGNGAKMRETFNVEATRGTPEPAEDVAMANIVQASRRWGAEQMRFAIIQKLEKVGSFLGDELQTVLALIHSTPLPTPHEEE
jgi:hypothetical protein